jgi:hypothetical protein
VSPEPAGGADNVRHDAMMTIIMMRQSSNDDDDDDAAMLPIMLREETMTAMARRSLDQPPLATAAAILPSAAKGRHP